MTVATGDAAIGRHRSRHTAIGSRRRAGLKRLLDVAAATILLTVATPLMLLITVVVGLSSRGPVLYRQQRIGRNGRSFMMYKFRTMHVDADTRLDELRALNDIAGGPLFKIRNDPRVTGCGRWLRRFSLDELPQLFNVLTGSMSLVGPRPALPQEVAGYSSHEEQRLLVKPGITGLWQTSGRSDLSWQHGVALDLHYVEHGSLTMDLVILLRTIPAVLLSRGAY